ncbi:MAG: ribosome-binding factor A [Patescibacteria group bacterium]
MPRIEQVNQLLKSELANLINREINLADCLITISYVDCAADLSNSKIGISVLPAKYARKTLEELKKNSSRISNILRKKTRLRRIPRFHWRIDETEKNAAQIEELLDQIKKEK